VHPCTFFAVVSAKLLMAIKLDMAVPCVHHLLQTLILVATMRNNEESMVPLAVFEKRKKNKPIPHVITCEYKSHRIVLWSLLAKSKSNIIYMCTVGCRCPTRLLSIPMYN
jgi:hypothetical protein